MTGLLPRRVLPVLMYHRLGSGPGDPALWLDPLAFTRHLELISERGLRTLTLDQAYEAFATGTAPRDAVLITFDDAFAETLGVAGELLAQRRMRAAAFAPAALLGRTVSWPRPGRASGATEGEIAGAAALRQWIAAGHGVGSHGLTHADLATLPTESLRGELSESRSRLEQALGSPVPDLCYPFTHHDATVRREAAAVYRAAYAGEPPRLDLFSIPRMMVFPSDEDGRFSRKVSGHYYWISAWHRRLTRLVPRGRGGHAS
jgi:peptidoglycan/xylan/chitin deacetylase (PgdA/CDA1 family)